MKVDDGDPCSSKGTRVIDGIETTEALENGHIGIRTSPPRKVSESVVQTEWTCTNTGSMGNKQEELEALGQQENYDIVVIMEAVGWLSQPESFCGWLNTLQKYGQERRGDEVALNGGDNRIEFMSKNGKAKEADMKMTVGKSVWKAGEAAP